ncbi:MAG: sugar transferase [bacterium]
MYYLRIIILILLKVYFERVIIILIKRILDIIFSTIGLIILMPVFLFIALLIKIDSKGPVFFKQDRLGKDGKIFKIYKFRSMVQNAENMGAGLFSEENDFRITRVGKFLREKSLDELPQIINILKGDMSLVGPRPPVPYHPCKYNEYSESQKTRFSVLPGITGYAQIKGRNDISWDKRIEYDILYVNKYSLLLDVRIIFETIKVVLFSKGIYDDLSEESSKNIDQ